MKLWKIVLYILCALIIGYWFLYLRREGFQIETPDITVQNVSYSGQYNEGYLVAPNATEFPTYIDTYKDTLNSDGTLATNTYAATNSLDDTVSNRTYYTDAYTFSEAQAACSNFGATLVTPQQMKTLADLGGFWSVASWASDQKMYAMIPKEMEYSVPNTLSKTTRVGATSSTLFKFNEPAPTQKAFPVCWGVKPVEPTVNVIPFNQTEYSMFTTSLLYSVMYPAVGELFQVNYTTDQAVYALQRNNYNINDQGLNSARNMLVESMGSTNINNDIYKISVGSEQYSQDVINKDLNPCVILSNTLTTFKKQFDTLRTTMVDVNRGVLSMESAKEENARFQKDFQSICEIESPTTSPACAKLATLDFDLLYNTQGNDTSTSRLAALEALNNTLFQRQQEMCMALIALSQVHDMIPTCSGTTANMVPSECACVDVNSGSTVDSKLCPSASNTDAQGSYTWTVNGVKANDVEYLKYLLQQISPYFAVSTYRDLLNKVITQLAITIELPSLNDFNTSNDNFNAVNKEITAIGAYLSYNASN